MVDINTLNEIRREQAKIRIGKKGLTENIITEVKRFLDKNPAVKIKCLKTVPKEKITPIAENIANLTNSQIIEIRGKTFILLKK